jgi:hypothetical protein
LVVVKESAEEIVDQETKYVLEICIGCRDVLPSGRAPLQHCAVREKVFARTLQISLSSDTDGWNKCGCEAAMAREEDYYKHDVRANTEAEGVEKLKKKW